MTFDVRRFADAVRDIFSHTVGPMSDDQSLALEYVSKAVDQTVKSLPVEPPTKEVGVVMYSRRTGWSTLQAACLVALAVLAPSFRANVAVSSQVELRCFARTLGGVLQAYRRNGERDYVPTPVYFACISNTHRFW